MSENKLTVKWSEKEQDHMIDYPSSPDGGLIQDLFFGERFDYIARKSENIVRQLQRRGYDIKTLRFSIKKKSSNVHNTNKKFDKGVKDIKNYPKYVQEASP